MLEKEEAAVAMTSKYSSKTYNNEESKELAMVQPLRCAGVPFEPNLFYPCFMNHPTQVTTLYGHTLMTQSHFGTT